MSERRKWVLGLIAAFLFGIAGGAVGALGVVALYTHHDGPPRQHAGGSEFERGYPRERADRGREPRRRGRPPMERMVTRQLDLSDEQRAAVERILDAARPRYAAVRESTRAEIDRVLTPEQRAKLKAFEDRFPGPRRSGRGSRDTSGTP